MKVMCVALVKCPSLDAVRSRQVVGLSAGPVEAVAVARCMNTVSLAVCILTK